MRLQSYHAVADQFACDRTNLLWVTSMPSTVSEFSQFCAAARLTEDYVRL